MTVKFRVGFDISGETLFAMIAKMLPVENVSVEELRPTVASRLSTVPNRLSTVPNRLTAPKPDLTRGINAIIMAELKEGPKSAVKLGLKIMAAGFSKHSVNSRLEELRRAGVIERAGDGTWKIHEA